MGHCRETLYISYKHYKIFEETSTCESLQCLGASQFNRLHLHQQFYAQTQQKQPIFQKNDQRKWKMNCLQQCGMKNVLGKMK